MVGLVRQFDVALQLQQRLAVVRVDKLPSAATPDQLRLVTRRALTEELTHIRLAGSPVPMISLTRRECWRAWELVESRFGD